MKNAVKPYLHFEDNCMEVMQYYQKVFGGDLEIRKVSESPVASQFPEEIQNQVMHACLKTDAFLTCRCPTASRQSGADWWI